MFKRLRFVVFILCLASLASAQMLIKNSEDNTLMTVTQDGAVGIGPFAPQDKLDVMGDIILSNRLKEASDRMIYVSDREDEGLGYSLTIRAGKGMGFGTSSFGGNLYLEGGRQGDPMPIYNYGHVVMASATGMAARVGIGTSDPQAKLDIAGAMRLQNVASAYTGYLPGTIRYNGTDFEGYIPSGWVSLTAGAGGASQWLDVTDGIHYSDGKVGVGTSQLSHQLTVMGSDKTGYLSLLSGFMDGTPNGAIFSINTNNDLEIVTQLQSSPAGPIVPQNIVTTSKTGIGTLVPREQLSVVKDGTPALGLYRSLNPPFSSIGAQFMINANSDLHIYARDEFSTSFTYQDILLTEEDGGKVGIGTSMPREKMEIGGALILGNNNETLFGGPFNGTIRYTGLDFEGCLGGSWVSLTSGGGSSLWLENGNDTYYSDGRVGVGISAPGANLHVRGALDGTILEVLRLENHGINSGGAALTFVGGDGLEDGRIGSRYDEMIFSNGSTPTERMRLTSTGRLGIGTTDPQENLHVRGNIALGDHLVAGTGPQLYAVTRPDAGKGYDLYIHAGRGVGFGTSGQGGDLYLDGGRTGDTMPPYSYGNIIMQRQNGTLAKVGIGTTAPLEKLDVDGAVRIGMTTSTTTFNAGTMRWTGSDFEGFDGASWLSLTAQGSGTSLWSQNGSDIYYEKGRVGVGTSTPPVDLTVFNAVGPTIGLYSSFSGQGPTGATLRTNDNDDLEIHSFFTLGPTVDKNIVMPYGNVGIGTSTPTYKLLVEDGQTTSTQDLFAVREWVPGSPFNILHHRLVVTGAESNGNVGIGIASPRYKLNVAGAVMLHDVGGKVDPTANESGIYSNGGELYALDDQGNSTQISPHDELTGEWIYYSKNIKTGRVVKVNMEKLVKKIEELTGESFLEEWQEE